MDPKLQSDGSYVVQVQPFTWEPTTINKIGGTSKKYRRKKRTKRIRTKNRY